MVGEMRGRRDGHCSRRYVSYWNAFLFISMFICTCFVFYLTLFAVAKGDLKFNVKVSL